MLDMKCRSGQYISSNAASIADNLDTRFLARQQVVALILYKSVASAQRIDDAICTGHFSGTKS